MNPSNDVRELLCQICDRDYPVWYAPSELWNQVMRTEAGDRYQFVCLDCFALEGEKLDIKPTAWKLTLETKKEPEGSDLEYPEGINSIPSSNLEDIEKLVMGATPVNSLARQEQQKLKIKKIAQEIADNWIPKEAVLKALEPDIGTSTHGNCCTCTTCHYYHDDCVCTENTLRQEIKKELGL